jgi:tetratricopeptide (TPR) repeat protein
VLAEGAEIAAKAGATTVEARSRVLLADVHSFQGRGYAAALAECEQAAAALETADDLEGLAEALTSAGRLRFWLGDVTGSEEILERAIVCARDSGNHRAQMKASDWLAVTFHTLPIPADDAVARTEQLLQDASGDPWAEAELLRPLCVLYAYVGRSADARAAITRSLSLFASFGAEYALAETGIPASIAMLIIGDPAAAERYARKGFEAYRVIGQRSGALDLACLVAEALYDQDRCDEAQQVIDEANTDSAPDRNMEIDLTQAKLLARRGQFAAARQLIAQKGASVSQAPLDRAEVLKARAEVDRLAGAPDQAAASLRAALQFYEDLQATARAEKTRAILVSLTTEPGREPTKPSTIS